MLRKLTNKKGFSLIELIASISIMLILLCIGASLIKNVKRIINNNNVNYCTTSIIDFINYSKLYCRSNDLVGFIYIDNIDNEISLNDSSKKIKTFHMPQGFKIKIQNKITIGSNGVTSDACIINYFDSFNKSHKVSMCVGTAFVQEAF